MGYCCSRCKSLEPPTIPGNAGGENTTYRDAHTLTTLALQQLLILGDGFQLDLNARSLFVQWKILACDVSKVPLHRMPEDTRLLDDCEPFTGAFDLYLNESVHLFFLDKCRPATYPVSVPPRRSSHIPHKGRQENHLSEHVSAPPPIEFHAQRLCTQCPVQLYSRAQNSQIWSTGPRSTVNDPI